MTYLVPNSLPDSADHWLAYRYLTGELSDDEVAACEARLESDLPLQVALAECVELTSGLARLSWRPAVRAASPASSTTAGGRKDAYRALRRSPMWAVAAVGLLAVGLLFMSALVAPRQMAWQDRHGTAAQVLDASSVVAMWSELGDEGDLASVGETESKLGSLHDDDLEIPDWMLVAVLEESDEEEGDETPQERQL